MFAPQDLFDNKKNEQEPTVIMNERYYFVAYDCYYLVIVLNQYLTGLMGGGGTGGG